MISLGAGNSIDKDISHLLGYSFPSVGTEYGAIRQIQHHFTDMRLNTSGDADSTNTLK